MEVIISHVVFFCTLCMIALRLAISVLFLQSNGLLNNSWWTRLGPNIPPISAPGMTKLSSDVSSLIWTAGETQVQIRAPIIDILAAKSRLNTTSIPLADSGLFAEFRALSGDMIAAPPISISSLPEAANLTTQARISRAAFLR